MLKGEKLKVWLNLLTALNCCGAALFIWLMTEQREWRILLGLSGFLSLMCGFVTLITLVELKDRDNQLGLSERAKFMQQIALLFYSFPVAYCFAELVKHVYGLA